MKRAKIISAAAACAVLLTSCSLLQDNPPDDGPKTETIVTEETPVIQTTAPPVIVPEIPDYPLPEGPSSRYGYYQLSEQEQRIYRQICSAVREFKGRVHLAEPMSQEQVKRICEMMNMEENDLYYLTDNYEYNYYEETGEVFELSISYRFNRGAVEELNSKTEEKIQKILDKLTPEMTEYQKIKLFHDEIVWGCYYRDKGDFVSTPYGALVDGRALCEGYARAFAELCNREGIRNCFVSGETEENGRSVKHLWNMVELDGEWYHVDLTWDDPVNDPANPSKEVPEVQYNYFCISDKDLEMRIVPDRTLFTLPEAASEEYNYFRYYSLYATSYEQAEAILRREIKNSYKFKSRYIYMRFSNEEIYRRFVYHYLVRSGGQHIFDEEMTPAEYDVWKYILWRVDEMYTIQLRMAYWDEFNAERQQ